MRCSSSEAYLDAHVDGTLAPARAARLDAHLATCDACRSLAAELRSIDALLLAPRILEPQTNLTFAVMAEARALPSPRVRRASPLAIVAVYIAFAWITIAAFLALGGSSARAMLATIGQTASTGVTAGAALASASARLFGHHTFDVTAAMGALLALDAVVASAIVAVFAYRRARFAASEGC